MRGSDADVVDDLVQVTFLRAFGAAVRFHGTTARAWLHGIAANVVKEHARKEIRRKRALSLVAECVTSSSPPRDPTLARLPVLCAVNPAWAEGLGSSLQLGIQTLNKFSASLEGAVVLLGDQPNLSAAAIDAIAGAGRNARALAAAGYGGAIGAPAYFPREYFEELLALPASAGAQALLKRHATTLITVPRPELAVDLDTPEEFQRYVEAAHDSPADPA
jgi:molybdenum cofactor cytidylyltransferase